MWFNDRNSQEKTFSFVSEERVASVFILLQKCNFIARNLSQRWVTILVWEAGERFLDSLQKVSWTFNNTGWSYQSQTEVLQVCVWLGMQLDVCLSLSLYWHLWSVRRPPPPQYYSKYPTKYGSCVYRINTQMRTEHYIFHCLQSDS